MSNKSLAMYGGLVLVFAVGYAGGVSEKQNELFEFKEGHISVPFTEAVKQEVARGVPISYFKNLAQEAVNGEADMLSFIRDRCEDAYKNPGDLTCDDRIEFRITPPRVL